MHTHVMLNSKGPRARTPISPFPYFPSSKHCIALLQSHAGRSRRGYQGCTTSCWSLSAKRWLHIDAHALVATACMSLRLVACCKQRPNSTLAQCRHNDRRYRPHSSAMAQQPRTDIDSLPAKVTHCLGRVGGTQATSTQPPCSDSVVAVAFQINRSASNKEDERTGRH
jgi:hypothetical protein